MVNGRRVLNQSPATVGSQFSVKCEGPYLYNILDTISTRQRFCLFFQILTSALCQMAAAVISVLILQEATNVNVQTRN